MSTTPTSAAASSPDSISLARAAFLRGDLRAILDLVGGSSNIDVMHVWCLTMGALYGPGGLSDSCFGPDGTVKPEIRATPIHRWPWSKTVGDVMDEARAELATALGLHAQALEPRTFLPSKWAR